MIPWSWWSVHLRWMFENLCYIHPKMNLSYHKNPVIIIRNVTFTIIITLSMQPWVGKKAEFVRLTITGYLHSVAHVSPPTTSFLDNAAQFSNLHWYVHCESPHNAFKALNYIFQQHLSLTTPHYFNFSLTVWCGTTSRTVPQLYLSLTMHHNVGPPFL